MTNDHIILYINSRFEWDNLTFFRISLDHENDDELNFSKNIQYFTYV